MNEQYQITQAGTTVGSKDLASFLVKEGRCYFRWWNSLKRLRLQSTTWLTSWVEPRSKRS